MVGILRPKAGGRPIVIDKAVILVGRHPDCDYVLQASRKVSRRHVCLVQVNDRYVVRDLGSMNGVTVNGTRVEREQRMKIGDEVAIGDIIFHFEEIQRLPRKKREVAPVVPAVESAADASSEARTPTPPDDQDLSQAYPIAIPDEEQSFVVVAPEDEDVIEVIEIDEENILDDLDGVEIVESDSSVADRQEFRLSDEFRKADAESGGKRNTPVRDSVEDFVPVIDVDGTIDSKEIDDIIVLDDIEILDDDDDIIVLD